VRRCLCVLALAITPSIVHATNGNTPRTPALYPPHACMAHVDRSETPIFHFDVTIPFEDVTLTQDELGDSRTFQFFALCRDDHRLVQLPNWITMDDAMRALDLGLIPALPADDDVLTLASHWQPASCVQTINVTRMPISCEATGMGVQWDTTDVPAGNYVIRGYTFAPAANLWTTRLGVVQVGDDASLAPIVALTSPVYEPKAYQQSGFRILGCMGGPEGTMVTLAFAATTDDNLDDESAWTPFAELDAAKGEIDELLSPPESAIYQGLIVRGVARAPDGTSWTGYAPGFVTIYPGDDASDDPVLPPGPDYCEVGGDTSGGPGDEGTSSGGSSGETGTEQDDGGAPGCGCVATPRRSDPWALLVVIALRRRARVARSPSFVQECARR
jgi:hypothetical protein